MITIPASSSEWLSVTLNPFLIRFPARNSESTVFLEQPKVMILTSGLVEGGLNFNDYRRLFAVGSLNI